MGRRLIGLALSAMLMATPAFAGPGPSEDVLGRAVPAADGRATVVIYANRDNEKMLGRYAMPLLYELREQSPRVIVKVDLSDVPGLFHGVARKKAREGFDQSLRDMTEFFAAKGESAPADMKSQFFLVADMEGEAHRALGLPEGFDTPVVQALGPDGKELVRGKLTTSARRVEKVLSGSGDTVAGLDQKSGTR
ncbi:MAG TPA: hypothetical protein VK013_16405 [Myxococcaceae bacterium]|nr:hypothetical protein [Myxococcaceae bacterium]